MMNDEFKHDVLKTKENNPNMDFIDAMIEKFNDYVDEKHKASEFLNRLEEVDERCLLVRLFGNYHYQVNNGGHFQYFDNGFASMEDIDGGCFGTKTAELDIHFKMIELFEKYLPNNETTVRFINNLKSFKNAVVEEECGCCDGNGYYTEEVTCDSCNGSGWNDDENCECSECDGRGSWEDEYTCCECHGDGVNHDSFTVCDGDILDDEYYAIEDDVLKVFNSVVGNWLTSDTDCELNEFQNAVIDVKNSSVKAKLKLVGTDGNAFAIMGKVVSALKDQKVSKEKVEQYLQDAKSGDYNNLLAVSLKYCDEANIEVC